MVAKKRKSGYGSTLLITTILALGFCAVVYVLFAHMIIPSVNALTMHFRLSAESPEIISNFNAHYETSGLLHIPGQVPNMEFIQVNLRDISDTGYLALINRQHSIPAEPDFRLLESAWPTVPVSTVNGMYLHMSALRAVEELFDAARRMEIGSFFVSSGFRCYEIQTELYADGANSAFTLPPGHSEHHTGLAVDILSSGVSMSEMGNSREGRWLANNAYRYGLILRYPQGAEDITGIEFEPWHFRYVGRVHAYYMMQNNLVLEEYIEFIQNLGSISFEKDGITYYILHQVPQNGMISLPVGMNHTISNDNSGGYIVTAWR